MDTRIMSVVELGEGQKALENFITRLKNMMEGLPGQRARYEERWDLYTLVYRMCTQSPRQDRKVTQKQLYDMYVEVFVEYINSKVLPALQAKHGEDMLKEFVKRWDNHKIIVRWLSLIFMYLDEYFRFQHNIPTTLKELGVMFFLDLVYDEIEVDVKNAVIAVIHHELEGGQIDQQLVKKVLEVFVEIKKEEYEADFETFMLEDTVAYFRKKASSWTSCSSYMRKTKECLEQEKERANYFLHASSKKKLLEKVQMELVSHYKKLHVRCVLG